MNLPEASIQVNYIGKEKSKNMKVKLKTLEKVRKEGSIGRLKVGFGATQAMGSYNSAKIFVSIETDFSNEKTMQALYGEMKEFIDEKITEEMETLCNIAEEDLE